MGADGMNETTIDLSQDSQAAGADPNGFKDDLTTFYGFFLIAGWELAEGSLLLFDDISVGDVSACSSTSLSGDWTFTFE